MAIPESESPNEETSNRRVVFDDYLADLRREIGALRDELIVAGQVMEESGDASYSLATQIDLLVNKYLRLTGGG